jgi:acetylxylan esterase
MHIRRERITIPVDRKHVLFSIISAYSGVVAGYLVGFPGLSPTTANPNCTDGKKIVKTQEAWEAQAKTFYPGYNGI